MQTWNQAEEPQFSLPLDLPTLIRAYSILHFLSLQHTCIIYKRMGDSLPSFYRGTKLNWCKSFQSGNWGMKMKWNIVSDDLNWYLGKTNLMQYLTKTAWVSDNASLLWKSQTHSVNDSMLWFWWSISGKSSDDLHCGNVVNMPYWLCQSRNIFSK